MKRQVSDILTIGEAPLSFLQIKPGKYETVCPWCAKDLGKVKAKTYGELALRMFPIQSSHMKSCKRREAFLPDLNVFV
jgi:hypothetical protein